MSEGHRPRKGVGTPIPPKGGTGLVVWEGPVSKEIEWYDENDNLMEPKMTAVEEKFCDVLGIPWEPKTSTNQLTRIVVGALRSTIAAHGPITPLHIGSAAKRIVHQIRGTIRAGQMKQVRDER